MAGGNLCIDGTPRTVGDAPAVIATGKCTSGVIGLNSVQVQLKGTLRFVEQGFNLVVGSANFTMRRNVTWYYSPTSRTFTADVVVTGEVNVTQWPVPVSGAAKPVTCVMAGQVALESKVYPGECSANLLCCHTTACHPALGAMRCGLMCS
jgi:hypothetical protein